MFFPGRMSFLLSASPWKQRWLFHGSHAPCRLQALLQAHVGSTAIFPPLLSHRVLCLLSRYSGRGRPSWSRHLEGHSRYICMTPGPWSLSPAASSPVLMSTSVASLLTPSGPSLDMTSVAYCLSLWGRHLSLLVRESTFRDSLWLSVFLFLWILNA